METLTIPARNNNIHTLAADYDREIKFPKSSKFAVVLADYYGGKGYSTHKTSEAAIAQSKRVSDYSHQIIDITGDAYSCNWDGALVYTHNVVTGE